MIFLGTFGSLAVSHAAAQNSDQPTHQQLARDIFKELIEIRTTAAAGNTPRAARAMADRLLAVGFPAEDVQVVGPTNDLGCLVARLRGNGSGKRPILLMAHLDVVDALRDDWSMDPFKFLERDGYFYGRGTTDNKAGAAMLVANFVRFKQEGFVPSRDLVLALTADEETAGSTIHWLVTERRDLVDAEFALNTDAGGGDLKEGKPSVFSVQASEKVYLSFQLEVRNPGGHSSLPRKDNAIYQLVGGLARLARFQFPLQLTQVSRIYFERSAAMESEEMALNMKAIVADPINEEAAEKLSESPHFNAMLHTTCVATRLAAGHADNALPQTARAVVNCRILPGQPPDEVEKTLKRVLNDDGITLTRINEPTPSPPSPLGPEILGPIERLTREIFPGALVVPTMSTGATDGLYVRNAGIPTYGVSALFGDPDDVRAHGRDERVRVKSFYDSLEFWYRMLKAFTSS
ncbi:MAG: M20/M25/M40 family metallo-hydrolase [Acidobacteriota bacterium]